MKLESPRLEVINDQVLVEKKDFSEDRSILKLFVYSLLAWCFLGILLGIIISIQLLFPQFFSHEWLHFGKLKPLHINIMLYGFIANVFFSSIYYAVSNILYLKIYSRLLQKLHFWSWQLMLILASVTIPLGFNQGKEYSEQEWYVDILIIFSLLIFILNIIKTSILPSIVSTKFHVGMAFSLSGLISFLVLHCINSLCIPVSLFSSQSIFGGIQDAVIQNWYAIAGVASFLSVSFTGCIYLFLPHILKNNFPFNRISWLHFFGMLTSFIWIVPHHSQYKSLSLWARVGGSFFAIILLVFSIAGLVNCWLLLKKSFSQIKENPILWFWFTAIFILSYATIEGPLISIKQIMLYTQFTDWRIGHVHNGALGWNAFLAFGSIYVLVEYISNNQIYKKSLIKLHFYLSFIGLLFYVVSMLIAGIKEGIIWNSASNPQQSIVSILHEVRIFYYFRLLGGVFLFLGFLVMLWNLWKTVSISNGKIKDRMYIQNDISLFQNNFISNKTIIPVFLLILLAFLVGLMPATLADYPKSNIALTNKKPYTPLELAGRDVYIKEGCVQCHTQNIRPFVQEVRRYGMYSKPKDYIYDFPFLGGAKRTGPDLHNIATKYPLSWHIEHFNKPYDIVPNSIMPSYYWLFNKKIDWNILSKKLYVLKKMGINYDKKEILNPEYFADLQSKELLSSVDEIYKKRLYNTEALALIAYMNSLSKEDSVEKTRTLLDIQNTNMKSGNIENPW